MEDSHKTRITANRFQIREDEEFIEFQTVVKGIIVEEKGELIINLFNEEGHHISGYVPFKYLYSVLTKALLDYTTDWDARYNEGVTVVPLLEEEIPYTASVVDNIKEIASKFRKPGKPVVSLEEEHKPITVPSNFKPKAFRSVRKK